MKCRLFEGEMCSTVEQLAQERTMGTFVEFPVEDGGTLLVAVNDVDVRDSHQQTYRSGGTRDVVERSTRTMEAAVCMVVVLRKSLAADACASSESTSCCRSGFPLQATATNCARSSAGTARASLSSS